MKHVDEFRRLPGMIRGLPAKQFCLAGWWALGGCGTIGCVIGHAIHKGIVPEMVYSGGQPAYGLNYGWPAVEEYFGLSCEQAEHLFCAAKYGVKYKSRAAVANRIEQFIAEHCPLPIIEMKPVAIVSPVSVAAGSL